MEYFEVVMISLAGATRNLGEFNPLGGEDHMARGPLELLKLDRMIHDPTRLLILTFLYPVAKLDYLALRKRLGLTTGNLSRQLQKLESAGIVRIEKGFKGKYPRTVCSMSKEGRKAFELYAQVLKEISKTTESSSADEE